MRIGRERVREPERDDRKRRRPARALAVLAIAGATLVVGCADDGGDDLSPIEPEAGEQDTEIVPGEDGPVD